MIHARASFLALLVAILAPGFLIGSSSAQSTDPDVVPGRYIVVYRDDIVVAAETTELYENDPGIEISHVYQYALDGFAAELSPEAVRELEADFRVAEVVPDRKMYPFAQTITPGANRIDADLNPFAAIDGVDNRVNADIAILDMGVGPHPDINVVGGFDCTGQGTTLDNGGHGTHVAGIAGALDNNIGMVGVAPGARIWSVKVLDAFDGNWSWVICGIDWVTSRSSTIEVANMSIGERLGPNNQVYDGPMRRAIQRSVAAGVTYVVAAGNGNGDASTVIPARYPEVITVSAIADTDGKPGGLGPRSSAGRDDYRATFSSYGAVVDIAAPGVDTYSLAPYGGYSRMSGTSFATPHVAGAVALYTAQFGRVGPAAIRTALLQTADPGPIPGDTDGYAEGVLNVGRFGSGSVDLSASSGVPGATFRADFSDFPESALLTLSWDGNAFETISTNASGEASLSITVPSIAKGAHILQARSGTAFGSASFTIKPVVKVTPTSGPVGQSLKVVLRGFSSRDTIDVLWNAGSTSTRLATVTASSSGNVNAYVTVPATAGGTVQIIADSRTGGSVKASFQVTPTLKASPTSGSGGARVRLTLRGFQSREVVDVRFVSGIDDRLITESTMSATGSRNIDIVIPNDFPTGPAEIRLTGSKGTAMIVAFDVTGSAEASETDQPDATPETSPTPSPVATETPTTEADTEAPTIEPPVEETLVIDQTATIEPTPTPDVDTLAIRRATRSNGADAPRAAFDNDPGTVWTAPSHPARPPFILLDMGTAVTIGEVRILFDGIALTDGFEVFVSNDRREWAPLGSGALADDGWTSINGDSITARYVKIQFSTSDRGQTVGGIAEIEILA